MAIALIVLTVVCLLWLIRRMQWARQVNKLPGTAKCPIGIIGDFGFVNGLLSNKSVSPLQNILPPLTGFQLVRQDIGILRVWIGPVPHIFIMDCRHAEAVLSSNELITKGFKYNFLVPWLGRGLLTSTGDKWRKNRKMLTPSFHFQILEQFVPIMSRNGKILVEKLETTASNNDGLIPDLSPFILLCALDVICETAMGERIDAQSDPDGKYIRAVHAIGTTIMERTLKPWLSYDPIFKLTQISRTHSQALETLHGFTDSVIKSRLREISSGQTTDANTDDEIQKRKKEPFMNALIREHLQNPDEFTLLNVREEVDTFMFEGHDTTAWGIVWCIYLLGLNPESQERVQDEVDALFAGKQKDEELTLDELRTGLPYTEAVVKETQRLFPSVPLITRTVEKDTKLLQHEIPAGCEVVVVPTLIHHDPRNWTDPQKFKPERFLSGGRHDAFSFIPFSAGPRNCIGQKFAMLEQKALIAKIFRKFNVKSLDQRDVLLPTSSLILKSDFPIRVVLKARDT